MAIQIFKAAHVPLFLILTLNLVGPQRANEWSGFYPESYARKVAMTKAMPIYPLDAIERGITGVVEVKIAIDERGEVAKMKIHPATYASLKQSVADAVIKWTFKLRPESVVAGRYSLSRLTFKFSIHDGQPLVELYYPGPEAKDSEHLGYSDGMKEAGQWRVWEEVQATKNQN